MNISSYISLLNEYKSILNPIRITLDGTKEIHDRRRMYCNGEGTFDNIVNSIEVLLKNDISVNCRVNIDKEYINSLVKLGHYIQEKKWFDHNKFNCTVALVVNHQYNVNIPTLLDESEAAIKLIDLYCEDEIIKFFYFSQFIILNQMLKLL